MITIPKYWLGDEAYYSQLVERIETERPSQSWTDNYAAALMRGVASRIGLFSDWDEEQDQENVSIEDAMALDLIEVYDNVGMIKIEGGLVQDESIINRFFGLTSYSTVARALNLLVSEDSITDIVMAYSSPGGSASGVGEASDAIISADANKPVYSWTGSDMQSAAYWMGSSARKVFATKLASVGSIGAVATFVSRYRMLKDNGMDAKVVRSSPKKAVPHPLEKLTKEGEAQLEKTVNFYHDLFVDHVVSRRGGQLSSAGAKTSWASGESFFGEEAKTIGLIDGPLMPVDALISELIQAHNESSSTSGDPQMVRRFVLNSEKDRASISAGVPIQSVAMSEELSEPSSAQALPETPVEPVVEAVAGEPEVAAEAPAVVEEAPATSQPGPVADSGQFSSYLNTLTAQIETLRTENTSLREAAIRHSLATEAKDAEMENLRATLPVLRKAIARLEIGLGHRESKLEGASPSMLIETYESLYAELMNLPTGRKSEPPASEPNPLSDLVAQRIASISH